MRIGRWLAGLTALLACMLSIAPAPAQVPAPPVRQNVDGNGVDVVYGSFNSSMTDISIGPAGPHGLAYTRYYEGGGWRDSSVASISGSSSDPVVSVGGSSDSFHLSGSTYQPTQGRGAGLVLESGTGDFVYTSTDGTMIRFGSSGGGRYGRVYANLGWAKSITYTDGTVWTFTYKTINYCVDDSGDGCSAHAKGSRLQSLVNSLGYQLKFSYASDSLANQADYDAWSRLSRVTAINSAVDYCNPAADSCSTATAWPHADYGYDGTKLTEVTDPIGRTWHYGYDGYGKLTGLRRPDATTDDVAVSYEGSGKIHTVTRFGHDWTYGYSIDTTTAVETTTITDPLSHMTISYSDINTYLVGAVTDENGRTTGYSYYYDPGINGLLKTVTAPEGNFTTYTYDGRGNALSATATPKAGSGLSALTTSATYPSSCSASGITAANCNRPLTSTDAAGNVTNYAWNADGSPSSVEAPAPVGSSARPKTSYGYTLAGPWLKNASGTITFAGATIRVLDTQSTCRTTASCGGTADEAKTSYAYTAPSSSVGSNLLVASTTSGPGAGATATNSATVQYAYDSIGNVVTVTDPTAQESQTRYNAARQVTATWGPDPDGTGPRRPRAVVTHYQGDGQPDSVTQGTVNADGSSFTELQYLFPTYDGYGRKATERVNVAPDGAMTSAYALTQYSYDAVGRLQCTAVRMTKSAYGSLPPDACTQSTSANTDRISKTTYEYGGAVDMVETGVGSSGPDLRRTEVHYTHTANGQVETVTDAKGNVTSYWYDGFDRLFRTCYNQATPATCASLTSGDFVQFDYGTSGAATGKVVHRSIRGLGASIYIGYGYDALGRVTSIDYPGSYFIDSDVTLSYDLLGRLLSAVDTNGHMAAFGYDALGRVTSQGDALSTRTMEYDAAGRRTKFTWSDGVYVTYGYDATGAMTTIREGGSTLLATFGYDDLGRRKSLVRGNGVATSYCYNDDPALCDGASPHLTKLGLDLAGTANDRVLRFQYNQAGQIVQRTSSNDAYAWTQHYNVSRGYTSDALNRYSAIGSLTPVYDVKGNLAQAGGSTYSYDTKNELVITSDTGKQFYYDPLGRLDAVLPAGGVPLAGFQYDGGHIADEFNPGASNAIVRRYVWGPGADEPLVWYEGSGTGDKRWLAADERGSVVAVTDGSGNATAINSYDEYGIPASTNLGRFQYTGQAWLPELGMYYYKARMYSPTLGRFMQTDPIGYGDGPNWYNYVGSDPVNFTDPLGLQGCSGAEFNANVSYPCVVTGPSNGGRGFGQTQSYIDWGFYGYPGDTRDQEDRAERDLVHEQEYCNSLGLEGLQSCRGLEPQSVSSSSGPVISLGGSLEGYIGPFGGGAGAGGYYDTGTGDAGVYGTTESASPQQPMVNPQGFGYGGSINLISVGVARDMSSFRGQYQTIGAGFGPVSVTYSFSVGHLFSPISVSIGLGVNAGPPTPVQFHNSYGNTSVLPLFRLRW